MTTLKYIQSTPFFEAGNRLLLRRVVCVPQTGVFVDDTCEQGIGESTATLREAAALFAREVLFLTVVLGEKTIKSPVRVKIPAARLAQIDYG